MSLIWFWACLWMKTSFANNFSLWGFWGLEIFWQSVDWVIEILENFIKRTLPLNFLGWISNISNFQRLSWRLLVWSVKINFLTGVASGDNINQAANITQNILRDVLKWGTSGYYITIFLLFLTQPEPIARPSLTSASKLDEKTLRILPPRYVICGRSHSPEEFSTNKGTTVDWSPFEHQPKNLFKEILFAFISPSRSLTWNLLESRFRNLFEALFITRHFDVCKLNIQDKFD